MAQSGYLGWVSGGWWEGLARLFGRRPRARAADAKGWRGIFGQTHEAPLESVRIAQPAVQHPLGAARKPAFATPAPNRIEARVRRLKRRAAIDMIDQIGLAPIPGQLWRFVDAEADPARGVAAFLRALGLDPDRLRRRDRQEAQRANAVLELLFMIDHMFDRVAPPVAAALEARLCSGDYEAVRAAAQVAQTFEQIARLEARWPASHRLAVLNAFLEDVRGGLADPLGVPPPVADHARRVADELGRQMRALDTELREGAALYQSLTQRWPSAWDHQAQGHARATAEAQAAEAHRKLLTEAGLRHGEVEALVARIAGANAQLRRLIEAIEGRAAPAPVASDIDLALGFFGFAPGSRPDPALLAQRFRALARSAHPDLAPPDPSARAAAHRRFVELNGHYEVLKALG